MIPQYTVYEKKIWLSFSGVCLVKRCERIEKRQATVYASCWKISVLSAPKRTAALHAKEFYQMFVFET